MVYRIRNNRQYQLVEDEWSGIIPWPLKKALYAIWNTDYWLKDLCWKVVKPDRGKVYLAHNINDMKVLTVHTHDKRYVVAIWEKYPKSWKRQNKVIRTEMCITPEELPEIVYTMIDDATNDSLNECMEKANADSLVYAIFDQAMTDYIVALDREDGAQTLRNIEKFLKDMNRMHLVKYAKERYRQLKAEKLGDQNADHNI